MRECTSNASTPLVLIVDDEEGFRFLTREALELNGFDVEEADCGEAALAAFESVSPDIVLLDVVMPGIDGYETCDKLRRMCFGHHVPIIMLTGRDDAASIEQAYAVGATDFLTKPPNYILLARRLWYVLRTSRYFAHFDSLTGLPSRTLLGQFMSHTIAAAQRQERPFAVVDIDLDDFQDINESIGHDAGDVILREASRRLRDILRAQDFISRGEVSPGAPPDALGPLPSISRVGGDEFILVLTDLSGPEDMAGIIERITVALNEPYQFQGERLGVRASIGVSLFPIDGVTWDELSKHAESAARHARRLGGNGHQYYSGELNERSRRRFAIERELRDAMDRDELHVYYQPKICMRSGALVGAEALLRWENQQLGWVSVGEFIEIAEQTGLIVPIGAWTLRTACETLRDWHRAGQTGVSVAVNLSPAQFADENLFDSVVRTVADAEIRPESLELEITEGILMNSSVANDQTLRALQDHGVKISVDDFGTGYSSLSYLQRFPLDKIKIDRAFVDGLTERRESAAIVNSIVSLGHSLGISVVAEGIESDEQRIILRAYGCDEGQGYLFGEPMRGPELLALAATINADPGRSVA